MGVRYTIWFDRGRPPEGPTQPSVYWLPRNPSGEYVRVFFCCPISLHAATVAGFILNAYRTLLGKSLG